MGWKDPLFGLAALIALWVLIRAFRGLWSPPSRTEKDSADLWLHADTGPKPQDRDGPVVDDPDTGDGDGPGGQ